MREEFHPKRNQARQKLATLPRTRFKDLSSDVFFELERRFPELREEFRPEAMEREDEDVPGVVRDGRQNSALSTNGELNRSYDAQGPAEIDAHQREKLDAVAAQPSTSDVVVPAKSSLVEEEINVPYAPLHEADALGDDTIQEPEERTSADMKRMDIRDSVNTNDGDPARSTMYSQASSIGTGFFNGYTNNRMTLDSMGLASPNPNGGRGSPASANQAAELEKIRSEYEFRIATMQHKLATMETRSAELEKQVADHGESLAATKETHVNEVRDLQKLADEFRGKHEEKHAELQDTLARLDELQGRHKELEESRSLNEGNSEELEVLRKDYAEQGELVTELRNEVESLVDELRQLSSRNDEILGVNETDQAVIKDLNNQVSSYKRKYEAAKTELRSLKATSQLFVQQPRADNDMTASASGAIADVSLTAFQSSIDELLASARSKNVGNVLNVYRSVVLSATLIMEDIGRHERDASAMSTDDREQLHTGKGKISSTLNNLMIACRNHAAGSGLSPVSLVDAAASHVSSAVVDMAKLIKVRKATKEEAEEFQATFSENGTLPNGLRPLHTNVLGTIASPRDTFGSPGSSDARRRAGAGAGEAGHDPDRLGTPSQTEPKRAHQGPSLGRYSPVGYRPDVTRKGTQGEVSWKSRPSAENRSRNPSLSSSSSYLNGSAEKAPAVPNLDDETLRRVASLGRSSSSIISEPRSPYGAGAVSSSVSPSASGFAHAPPSSRPLQEQMRGGDDGVPGGNSQERSPGPGPGSTMGSTPPPVPAFNGDESSEEHWAELRNYIEVQTEAIVHCIQALLSSIREGAHGNQLHENLTQITTIVSSIIAISTENIPRAAAAAAAAAAAVSGGDDDSARNESVSAAAAADCERILHDLSDHCEKLIEMQSIGGQFDKSTKSNMASASYGVAKGLKALNGLLNAPEQ